MSKCILCWEAPANTREHIFLKSLLKEILPIDDFNVLVQDKKTRNLKSHDSKYLKPRKYDLCEKCNTHVSQPYDQAVHRTTLNLIELSKGVTDRLKENSPVIKINVGEKDGTLERYFAKHLACSLNRFGYSVPKILGEIFHQRIGFESIDISIRSAPYNADKQMMENRSLEIFQPHFDPGNEVLKEYCQIGMTAKFYSYEVFYGTVEYKIRLTVPDAEVVNSFYAANSAYLVLKIMPLEGSYWLKYLIIKFFDLFFKIYRKRTSQAAP